LGGIAGFGKVARHGQPAGRTLNRHVVRLGEHLASRTALADRPPEIFEGLRRPNPHKKVLLHPSRA
jgi:hypothetical protein